MTHEIATTSITASTGFSTRSTKRLLACGVVTGPLFIIVALIQAFTRPGFEPIRHPLSLLSLGDLGWIQITNFVLGGLLFAASAVGMARVLRSGPGRRWGPWLIGVFGVSLVAGGVFLADPAFGFPPGTAQGAPEQLSWHGIVHGIAPVVGFLALIAACFVFARRFSVQKQRGWAAYSVVTGVVVLALSMWSNLTLNFVPLWVAMVVGFAWPSVMARRLIMTQLGQ